MTTVTDEQATTVGSSAVLRLNIVATAFTSATVDDQALASIPYHRHRNAYRSLGASDADILKSAVNEAGPRIRSVDALWESVDDDAP